MPSQKLLLLADADVLIHFFKGNQLQLLPKILPQQIAIVDAVVTELKNARLYDRIKRKLESNFIEIDLTAKTNVRFGFFELISQGIGSGESACMALAKEEGHYIASSNLRDVLPFCKSNKIRLYTTMDLLHEAYVQGLLDKSDCNCFINDVISNRSKLPCTNFDDYLTRLAPKSPWIAYDKA
jgi:predicted nucleic acid-binding protein